MVRESLVRADSERFISRGLRAVANSFSCRFAFDLGLSSKPMLARSCRCDDEFNDGMEFVRPHGREEHFDRVVSSSVRDIFELPRTAESGKETVTT